MRWLVEEVRGLRDEVKRIKAGGYQSGLAVHRD
jgi:hypothetical protein